MGEEGAAIAEAAPVATEAASRLREFFPSTGPLGRLFTMDTAIIVVRVLITLVLSLVFVGLVVTILRKVSKKRMDARTGGLFVKVVQYLGLAFVAFAVLDAANVNLSALLGAAGIVGIAIGFAAQTSVSNFISGIFIVSEKTFTQGDVLSVDGTSGIVYSIDAFSIKLRTFDNQLIRIPNETLIKTKMANITRFPARRLNIDILVTYDSDIERTRDVLLEVAAKNQDVLRNPEPVFMVKEYGDNGIELFFGVWCASDEWFQGNNSMKIDIKKRLDAEGIQFAYPTVTVYSKKA
ncbi:MAG: mechanosensitive ion channel family protein [Spirochaetes bacterium]|nr:mechanosensitive ion channel family protein [Spirochaetota bacterium]MBU1081844.1 mechanosensitive ion channel family protein [Spirochaetota bacterium]